jgi:hypothetical protein
VALPPFSKGQISGGFYDMTSVKFKLERGLKIQWPNCCAVCAGKATHEASTSFTATKDIGYYLVVINIKSQTYSIPYPVCRKHKIICTLLDYPARWSLFGIALYIFLIPFILWFLFSALFLPILDLVGLKSIEYISNSIGLIVIVLLMLYLSGIFKPVRISNIKDDSMKISIKNDIYFNNFKILNSDKIMNK